MADTGAAASLEAAKITVGSLAKTDGRRRRRSSKDVALVAPAAVVKSGAVGAAPAATSRVLQQAASVDAVVARGTVAYGPPSSKQAAAASAEGQGDSTMRQLKPTRHLFQQLDWHRRLRPQQQQQQQQQQQLQQQQPGQNRQQADVRGDQPASTSTSTPTSTASSSPPWTRDLQLHPEELLRQRQLLHQARGTPPGAPPTVNESLLWLLLANVTGCHPLCYYDQYMPREPHKRGIRPKMFTGSALANGHALMVNIHEHANGKSRNARQLAPECGRFLHVANMFRKRTPTWRRPGARNLTAWLYDPQGPQCLGCPAPEQVLRE